MPISVCRKLATTQCSAICVATEMIAWGCTPTLNQRWVLSSPVSLGAERFFRLKGKGGTIAFSEKLRHGSLLIMAGKTQKNFKHEVPKETSVTQPRINLTFRHIEHK